MDVGYVVVGVRGELEFIFQERCLKSLPNRYCLIAIPLRDNDDVLVYRCAVLDDGGQG